MHLVLIEGFSGTGKTCTAKALGEALAPESRVLLETARPHPIITSDDLSVSSYAESFHDRWRELVQRCDSDGSRFVIVEAAALQYPVNWLLCEGVASDTIRRCVLELSVILEPVGSSLIYLHQEPPVSHFRQTISSRSTEWFESAVRSISGTAFGRKKGGTLDSLIEAFVVKQRQLADSFFGSWPARKIRVDVSARDWLGYQSQIAQFVRAAAQHQV